MALRAIGKRNPALHAAAVATARRLAESPEAAPRWVGKDALRELTSPSVMRRLAAKRSKWEARMNAGNLRITTPTPRETVLTREFDAPRRLVFDALTKPELLRRWYGEPGWTMVVCEIDLRVGGAFRFVSRRPNGKDVGQGGVYREIAPPERIVYTESWEGWNPGECLVTTVLTEAGGRTMLHCTVLYPSQEVRDKILTSGLEKGASALYGKLDAFLAEGA